MNSADWSQRVSSVRSYFEKGRRRLSGETMMAIIDDVVLGLPRAVILEKNGVTADDLVTALGHVTTALQGGGSVRKLIDGGWYKKRELDYEVSDGFAAAWMRMRTNARGTAPKM